VGTDASDRAPLVSVIVPAFNAEATIGETLQSIAEQSYGHLEILVIDDGSTDRTAAIAAEFCRSDLRARLISKPNSGVASARNRGLQEANGDWVASIDADDLWHPAKIERQMAAAQAAPVPPGFVYCWFRLIDSGGWIRGGGEPWAVDGYALARLAYRNFVGNGSALLLSRSAALAAGGYDESLRAEGAEGCEDIALQLAVARHHPVAAVPAYLVGYRFHAGSMSRNPGRMLRSWRLTLDRFRAANPAVPPQALRWNAGIISLDFAEALALARHWPGAFRLLARAVRLDPLRTLLHLAYRSLRLVARLLRGRRGSEAVTFYEADPTAPMPRDPDAIRALERCLEQLDRKRMERLAAFDVRQSRSLQTSTQSSATSAASRSGATSTELLSDPAAG
jgi:glycosyltransferase involved in cell wall biosynthesis